MMTDYYPDPVTVTPEQITFGFGPNGDGGIALQIVAQCPPPIGALRINLAPGQAGTLYGTLNQFVNMTDEQTAQLVETIHTIEKES